MYVLSYVLITVQHHVPTTVDGDGFTFVEGRFGPFSTVAFCCINTSKDVDTGTDASPSWFFYVDSIWRQGDYINQYGPGTPVQQWMTTVMPRHTALL